MLLDVCLILKHCQCYCILRVVVWWKLGVLGQSGVWKITFEAAVWLLWSLLQVRCPQEIDTFSQGCQKNVFPIPSYPTILSTYIRGPIKLEDRQNHQYWQYISVIIPYDNMKPYETHCFHGSNFENHPNHRRIPEPMLNCPSICCPAKGRRHHHIWSGLAPL